MPLVAMVGFDARAYSFASDFSFLGGGGHVLFAEHAPAGCWMLTFESKGEAHDTQLIHSHNESWFRQKSNE